VSESTALVQRESWGGAAERGLQARQEREDIVSRVLRPESDKGAGDGDFGIIPGTKKPTLLKPGAEKITDSLNLYPDYEPLRVIEDFDRPLFHYQYRCTLRARGTDAAATTGIGSCNSMESRYRWRSANRVCPKCGQETLFKSKNQGEGFYCWAKKGGCAATFAEKDPAVTGQIVGKVANDDPYSIVNTVDKMAQKRSLVAAVLNLGFSEQFTQDVEDNPSAFGGHSEQEEAPGPAPRATEAPSRQWPARGVPPPHAASAHPPDAPVWRGKIVKMETKEGTTNNKPWTLFKFTGTDGETFGTFSDTTAEALTKLDGLLVEIVYEAKKNGNHILEFRDVTEQEAPFGE